MSEMPKMSEVVFCGAIGILGADDDTKNKCSKEVIKESIALAHLLCLRAKEYGLDNNIEPADYKTKLADLMVDYTEMLLNYEKCYNGIMRTSSDGLKDTFQRLTGIVKSKLSARIRGLTEDPSNYICKSWGNIAASRGYLVGYVARSLDELHFMTEEVAKNTHNQADAIKGCKAVNDVIFLARCGWGIDAIKSWINCEYKVDGELACSAYDMDKSCNDIEESYKNKNFTFASQAKNTVTAALVAVFNADSFEKALENAKLVGGDRHAVYVIVSALAAAFWPIPKERITAVKNYLSEKKAHGQITIYVGQNYNKVAKADINPEEISKQFNQYYGGLQRNTAPLAWKLKNTKLAVESLKTDLGNADEKKKKDIFKLLDLVTKDFLCQTQLMLPSDTNWNLKNELLGEIKTLLEQYFSDEKKLVQMLESGIGNGQNKKIVDNNQKNNTVSATEKKIDLETSNPKIITTIGVDNTQNKEAINNKDSTVSSTEKEKENNTKWDNPEIVTITDLSTEIPDSHGHLNTRCNIVKFGIVILTSAEVIVFTIKGLWWPLGGGVFVGIVLFGICQFIQNKICGEKSDLNNLSNDMSKPNTVVATKNMEEAIPAIEDQAKKQEK